MLIQDGICSSIPSISVESVLLIHAYRDTGESAWFVSVEGYIVDPESVALWILLAKVVSLTLNN